MFTHYVVHPDGTESSKRSKLASEFAVEVEKPYETYLAQVEGYLAQLNSEYDEAVAENAVEQWANKAVELEVLISDLTAKKSSTYSIVRWSSRRDLAEQALRDFTPVLVDDMGYKLRVVSVQHR